MKTRCRVDVVQGVLSVECMLSLLLVFIVLGLTLSSLYADELCLYLIVRMCFNLASRPHMA